jgi:hypothetical protein
MKEEQKPKLPKQRTIDRISFAFGVTLNTGNYSAIRVDERYDTDVAPGETVDDAFDRAQQAVIPDVFRKAQTIGRKFKEELPAPEPQKWRQKPQANRF